MAPSIGAPQTHNQPSRKGKRAWRKNVDVTEIQEGLENAREEVIRGGIIVEKPSEDLYTVDTQGSASIKKSYKSCKPLKADEIIAARSKVPAISTHRRFGDGYNIMEPSSKRRRGNGVKPREFERLKQLAYGGASIPKDVLQTNEAPDHDPWALTDPISNDEDKNHSYLEKAKPIRTPSTLKQPPVSLLATTNSFPAVPKPKAGTSYNPSFNEWNQLLISEGAREVEAERKRLAAKAEHDETLSRIRTAQNERDDYQTEDESAWEGFESEYEGTDGLKKRRPERKTQAERNKVKRRKEADRLAKHEAQMKKRERQASQIRGIAKQVENEAKARTKSAATVVIKDDSSVKEQEIDDRALRRRKFGKHALPEPPLELVLPDELKDSLRQLKPEGNLLKERFRNIMLRGKLETRNRIPQPKKARRTTTEKWTYKDFVVPTGA